MKEAVDDGAPLQAADAGPQTDPKAAVIKAKRAKRVRSSPAMEHVTQQLAQAGSAPAPKPQAANALQALTFHIGVAIDSLDLPRAKDRRTHVLSGFSMSYDTNQT